MKLRLFAPVLMRLTTVTLVTLGTTIVTSNQPSLAEDTNFFCSSSKGVPVTYARTSRGNVPMIRWVDNKYFPPPWTPKRRCEEVALRFQRNYDNGTLKNITTGTLRGIPAVCAASSQDEPCTDRTLLFTLKPGSNASLTVRRLLDHRGLAAGTIPNEASCINDCPIYINVAAYLNKATVEENSQSSSKAGNTP